MSRYNDEVLVDARACARAEVAEGRRLARRRAEDARLDADAAEAAYLRVALAAPAWYGPLYPVPESERAAWREECEREIRRLVAEALSSDS
jgi:hypothetical protein